MPVTNFESNITGGSVPLSVQFTDLSEDAVEKEWGFNGNGKIDSIDKSTVCVYATPGRYTAKLTVSNDNGTNSKLLHSHCYAEY